MAAGCRTGRLRVALEWEVAPVAIGGRIGGPPQMHQWPPRMPSSAGRDARRRGRDREWPPDRLDVRGATHAADRALLRALCRSMRSTLTIQDFKSDRARDDPIRHRRLKPMDLSDHLVGRRRIEREDGDGSLHCNTNPLFTATGRRSEQPTSLQVRGWDPVFDDGLEADWLALMDFATNVASQITHRYVCEPRLR